MAEPFSQSPPTWTAGPPGLLKRARASVTHGPAYTAFNSSWSFSWTPAMLTMRNQSSFSDSVPEHTYTVSG